jgi:hypothetical protein
VKFFQSVSIGGFNNMIAYEVIYSDKASPDEIKINNMSVEEAKRIISFLENIRVTPDSPVRMTIGLLSLFSGHPITIIQSIHSGYMGYDCCNGYVKSVDIDKECACIVNVSKRESFVEDKDMISKYIIYKNDKLFYDMSGGDLI